MPRNLGPLTAILLLASLLSLQAARDATGVTLFKSDRFTSVSDMAADAAGDIYICGTTLRPDALPGRVRRIGVPAPEQYQPFVLKLRPNGTAVSGIVLGGNAYGTAERIVIDGAGNVVVSGLTTSTNFPVNNALEPTSAGGWVPFLCKFNSSLSDLLFSTFLNGVYPEAVAVDAQNNILLAGRVFSQTASNFFPEFSPSTYGFDLFALKLGPEGTNVCYATRFAMDSWSGAVADIAVDTNGVANVVGMTTSFDFPLLNAVQPFKPARGAYANAFLTRIDSTGTFISSTFLGGHCGDQAKAVALNAAGEIYVAGITASDVFPALTEFPRTPCNGSNRGFLIRLGPGATNVLDARTFPVGTQDNVSSIVTFSDGSAVVGGTANASGDYPTRASVGFLAKIAPHAPTEVRFPSRDCDEGRSLNRLVLTGAGGLLGSGHRIAGTRQTLESYVVELNLQKLFSTEQPEPEIRVVSPTASSMVGVREPLTLAAITTAPTNDVTAVTFFADGEVLGVVMNRPYSIQIPPLPKGRHVITAEAQLPDATITSCPLPITVRSPRNDDFSRRIRLTGSRVSVSGNNAGATVEPGESFYDTRSVWYSWRAPRDGNFEFRLVGGTFYGTAMLLSGDELATLSRVTQFYAGSPLRLRCQRGTVYQIRVANYSDYGSTEFKLQIRSVTGPHNDRFENAEPLSGSSVTIDGSLANATTELPGTGTGHDVWYAWEAPATGLFLASLDRSDGFVSVFTGSNQADLVGAGQQIYGLTNGLAIYATAGITYFISVGAVLEAPKFTLSITPHAPPQNDTFAQRQLIPPGTLSATGSCLGATSDPLEGPPFFSGTRHSVWWRWVAPTSGVFRMSRTVPYPPYPADSSGLGALPRYYSDEVTVYSGFALGQLTAVSDQPWSSEIMWSAEAGAEYQIQVSGGAALLVLNIAPVARPTNDYFTNAVLVSSTAPVRGTTRGATLETGEPLHGSSFFPPRASVWYQWTAPTSGTFGIDGVWSLRIYTGDAIDSLTSDVYMPGDGVFAAVAGRQYRIAVFDAGEFSLRIRPAFPPPNDAFSNRTLLSGSNLHFSAEFFDASREPDEPPSFYYSPPTRTVWFSWTAPASGNFLLVATSSWTYVLLDVFTGDDLTNLTSVASTAHSQVDFQAVAGVTYHFRVDGGSAGVSDQAALQLRSRPSPANDNFSDRPMLTGSNVTISVSNIAATIESGEGVPYYAAQHSVWYSWTAPESGRASFVLDADFDAVLAFYTGDTLTNLTNIIVTGTFSSRFNIEVSAGTTYQLAVLGYGQSSGSGTLRIRYAAAPANDGFAQRSTLIDQPGTGTLEGATRETTEPGYAEDPSGSSVWWRWTAPTGGIYYLHVEGDAYKEVDVFTGTTLASLQTVAPSEGAHASVFYFPAQAGVEYAIRISTSFGDFSDYKLFLNYQAPPPNDAFTNRIAFTNGIAGTLKGATHEPSDPQAMQEGGSVWFQWTAPESGVFEAVTTERWISIDLAVYRGNSLTNLIRVSLSQDTPFGYPPNQRFEAISGETYIILVTDSYTWSGANFTLSVRPHISQPPPAPTPVIPVQASHRLALQPVPGQVVETSTNLIDWRLWTNAAGGPGVPIGSEPQRFFRIR
jgi:hypothetical protein